MNTGQVYDLFDALIDEVGTADASIFDKNVYINLAISDLINDRIRPLIRQKSYSLQVDSRLRSELGQLYVGPHTPTMNGAIALLPSNYWRISYLRMKNNSDQWVGVSPVSGAQASTRRDSSLVDFQIEPMFEETADGLYIHSGEINQASWSPSVCEMWYIKKFTEMWMGPKLLSGTTLTSGDIVYVHSGTPTYSGATYAKGDSFTWGAISTWTGSAKISKIINTELPDDMQREVARKAAVLYLKSMGEIQKAQVITIDEMNA